MTWDAAADFLLGLGYEDLYERADATPGAFGPFRCVGCRALVAPTDREKHHATHVHERMEARAAARREALAKARIARKEKASV